MEGPAPSCYPSIDTLEQVDINELDKCEQKNNEGFYKTPIEFSNDNNGLKFIITEDEAEAKNYNSICNHYCPHNTGTPGQCIIEDGDKKPGPYIRCIELLETPAGCSNSSRALAADETNGKIFWVYAILADDYKC